MKRRSPASCGASIARVRPGPASSPGRGRGARVRPAPDRRERRADAADAEGPGQDVPGPARHDRQRRPSLDRASAASRTVPSPPTTTTMRRVGRLGQGGARRLEVAGLDPRCPPVPAPDRAGRPRRRRGRGGRIGQAGCPRVDEDERRAASGDERWSRAGCYRTGRRRRHISPIRARLRSADDPPGQMGPENSNTPAPHGSPSRPGQVPSCRLPERSHRTSPTLLPCVSAGATPPPSRPARRPGRKELH